MVDALFETQKTWAVHGNEGKEKLLLIAQQAGISKEKFDQCLADKELFNKIVETRKRGNEEFGVDSTPAFFVNGKRLTGEHTLKDFERRCPARPSPKTARRRRPRVPRRRRPKAAQRRRRRSGASLKDRRGL